MEPSEPMGCTGQAQAVSEKEAVPPPPPPAPQLVSRGPPGLRTVLFVQDRDFRGDKAPCCPQ